jgi:hypothetical protein
MPFVVKVSGSGSFSIAWLGSDPSDGSCVFGSRRDALVFPSLADAIDAADTATKAFGAMGMTFSVEVAD